MSIEDKVKEIIAETLSIDLNKVVPEAFFAKDFGADSLDCLEVMMSIEEKFDIDEISNEKAFDILTVEDMIDYVKAKI